MRLWCRLQKARAGSHAEDVGTAGSDPRGRCCIGSMRPTGSTIVSTASGASRTSTSCLNRRSKAAQIQANNAHCKLPTIHEPRTQHAMWKMIWHQHYLRRVRDVSGANFISSVHRLMSVKHHERPKVLDTEHSRFPHGYEPVYAAAPQKKKCVPKVIQSYD